MTPMTTMNSLEMSLHDIEKALQAHLYYLALVVTMTLPDICAALESPDGATSKIRYIAWYNTHLAQHYTYLSAEDCYGIRCGMVHQGKVALPRQVKKVLFMLPNSQVKILNGMMGDAFVNDLSQFCRGVGSKVTSWYLAAKDNDPTVKANLAHLMRYYDQGFPPYVGGAVSLIA